MNLLVQNNGSSPVRKLGVTWVLLLPLLFFAVHGQFVFIGPSDNYYHVLGASSLVRSDNETVSQQYLKILVLSLALLFVFMKLKAVTATCFYSKRLVAFGVLGLASCFWSQFPLRTLEFSVVLCIDIFFSFYLARRFSVWRQIDVFMCLGWAAMLGSVFLATCLPSYGIDYKNSSIGWQGIFCHKNDCGIVMVFLLSGALFLPSAKKTHSISKIVYVVLVQFLIFMTASRTAWILLGTLLIYVFIVSAVRKFEARSMIMILVALFFLGNVLLAFVIYKLPQLLILIGKDPTATGRTQIWAVMFQAIMKHPVLGYGYRAFFNGLKGESVNSSLSLGAIVLHAQSGFLDVWLDFGFVGLAFLGFSITVAFKNAITCFRSKRWKNVEWYVSIVILTLVANIGERTLLAPNFLEWIMYLMACVGLNEQARIVRSEQSA